MSTTWNPHRRRKRKTQLRNLLVSMVRELDAPKVLSLPGETWTFERKLLKHASCIDGCEKDKSRYHRVKAAQPVGTLLFPGDISRCTCGVYDVVWLDYCSPLTSKIEATILQACSTTRHILAITLLAGRDRFHGDRERIKYMLDLVPGSWSVAAHPYRDTKSPMIMYILQRKKGN